MSTNESMSLIMFKLLIQRLNIIKCEHSHLQVGIQSQKAVKIDSQPMEPAHSQTNLPSDVEYSVQTVSTSSQTELSFAEEADGQTDLQPMESTAVQTHFRFTEEADDQTDAQPMESNGSQTDLPFAVEAAVQTVPMESTAVQTKAVQTKLLFAKEAAVQTDSQRQESTNVQTVSQAKQNTSSQTDQGYVLPLQTLTSYHM